MDVKTTFRNLVRDQSVSICMLQKQLTFLEHNVCSRVAKFDRHLTVVEAIDVSFLKSQQTLSSHISWMPEKVRIPRPNALLTAACMSDAL